MTWLLTLLVFAGTFWYFRLRTGRPTFKLWWVYALVTGVAIRWGIPLAWAFAKPLAGILIAIAAVLFVLSVLKRRASAPSSSGR